MVNTGGFNESLSTECKVAGFAYPSFFAEVRSILEKLCLVDLNKYLVSQNLSVIQTSFFKGEKKYNPELLLFRFILTDNR